MRDYINVKVKMVRSFTCKAFEEELNDLIKKVRVVNIDVFPTVDMYTALVSYRSTEEPLDDDGVLATAPYTQGRPLH